MISDVDWKSVLRTALTAPSLWAAGKGVALQVSGVARRGRVLHFHSQRAAGGDSMLPDLSSVLKEILNSCE